ncbi:hypothetical protein HPB52_021300 [Rhipicephalus sanguineus]|uniref:Uncharacterized protein n=1 Tax=Rhipicephalus sanguineus TaxID=34632 RepID=A0A9D4Q2R2_RHISA|nr:hypothetical protein HPB52_021300 [Rhipicephalus sanguineus]
MCRILKSETWRQIELLKDSPKLDKVEALSLVRAAAKKATAPEADRVVLECIEALPSKLASSGRINVRGIVSSLQEKNYKLLQSDKEGAFVVVHPDQYRLLSDKALSENFKEAEEFHPSKAKKVAVEALPSPESCLLKARFASLTWKSTSA